MQDENIYKTNFIPSFLDIAGNSNVEEVGISFDGETKISNDVSILTDKNIKIDTPAEAHKTYLKVMEVRDLTKEELDSACKIRKFFRLIFQTLFNGKMWQVFWGTFVGSGLLLNLYKGNILLALIDFVCLCVVLSPVKCFKEIVKFFTASSRLEKLSAYLKEQKVYGYVNSVDADQDIKLYVKFKKE